MGKIGYTECVARSIDHRRGNDMDAQQLAQIPDTSPSKALDDNAQELAATLRAAFDTWVHRDAPDNEQVWGY